MSSPWVPWSTTRPVYDEDAVGIPDGAEPVRDDRHGAPPDELDDGGLHRHLVEGVEQDHGCVLEQRSRDGDALPLAAGEGRPALPTGGVEAPGQRLDEVERRRAPGGLAHLLIGGVGPDHADVVRDGALEEGHVLEHDRHAGEHLVRVEPPLVGAAEQHAPRARVPEARREPADGGLARSGGPHERRSLPFSRGSVAPRAVGDLIDGMGAQPVPVRPAPFEYSACAAALSVGKLMFIAFFKRLCQNMELVL